jgi:integrase
VKTRGSRRRVPLHPELIRLGFLAYVAERRTAGDKRLFPALHSDRSQITAAFSTWWGRYTDKLGIADDRKVFHSFRHTVKRSLRDAGIDPALSDALQGHTAKDVAGRYGLDEEGSGFSLPALYAALSQLTYPGLDLSHLEPPTAESHPKQKQDEGGKLETAHG